MNMAVLKNQNDQHNYVLYITAIVLSLFLSAYIDFKEVVINPDAICYLSSAEAIGRLGFNNAIHLCGQAQWPFYSLLIYGAVGMTHLSYTAAAYTLDSIFSFISVLTFILITKELGGSRRVLWLAAAVILLSHEFNGVREYIIRDHGFWAFYLISILLLLRFFQRPTWQGAFCWSASLFIATLFRIEGAIFLFMLPFVSWCFIHVSMRRRFSCFVLLNIPLLTLVLGVGIWMFIHKGQTPILGRVNEVIDQGQHGFMLMNEKYHLAKAGLQQYVLNQDSAKEANLVLPLMLAGWYIANIIENLSWIYAILVLYAWRRVSVMFSSSRKGVLIGYFLVNIMITLGFLLEHFFLSKRYIIALSLTCMLLVPFGLNELIQQKRRILLTMVTFLIAFSALGGIFDFGYSKAYIAKAGDWLSQHVPKEAELYANDYQLMYYSHHFGDSIFQKASTFSDIKTIADGKWKQYDYIALRLSKKEEGIAATVLAQIEPTPVQTFNNKRGDRVVIYKVKP